MKFLDALRPTVRRSGTYSMDQWAAELYQRMLFEGNQYPLGFTTTYGRDPAEPIGESFAGYVQGGLKSNGIVYALELKRLQVFSQARFQYQRMREGRPGDLYGDRALTLLERPWAGGTTGDLLARMLMDADFAGNAFNTVLDGEVVRLRPDWVEIVLEARTLDQGTTVQVGWRQIGILYYEGGVRSGNTPAVFLAGQYSHFAPVPDPEATYRGMSWLTPVIRELQADTSATKHKLKFFENAATPNLAVSLAKEITPEQFKAFVAEMDKQHGGADNAYKTLYTAGGADVTVIGQNMQQLDFKVTQGAGETRLAAAAGVHPVIAGLSEGMQGSSLNAGNYTAAKRSFVDTTCRHLWQNAAGSLESLVPAPEDSRLWYDARDIPFLLDDMKDRAEIQSAQAQTIRTLGDAGYTSDSIKAAVLAEDWSLLQHSGLFSVQLQPPGTQAQETAPAEAPAEEQRSIRRHLPGKHSQESHGDGTGSATAAIGSDKLKLVGRMQLRPGEKLVASSRVKSGSSSNYLNSAVLASTTGPDGPALRLGIVDDEDVRKWRGSNRGGTVLMSAGDAGRVAGELRRLDAEATARAKLMRKQIAEQDPLIDIADDPSRDPDERAAAERRLAVLEAEMGGDRDQTVAEGFIPAGEWGDIAYSIGLVDDGVGGRWSMSVAVRPPGADADWQMDEDSALELDKGSLKRLLAQMDELRKAAEEAG